MNFKESAAKKQLNFLCSLWFSFEMCEYSLCVSINTDACDCVTRLQSWVPQEVATTGANYKSMKTFIKRQANVQLAHPPSKSSVRCSLKEYQWAIQYLSSFSRAKPRKRTVFWGEAMLMLMLYKQERHRETEFRFSESLCCITHAWPMCVWK